MSNLQITLDSGRFENNVTPLNEENLNFLLDNSRRALRLAGQPETARINGVGPADVRIRADSGRLEFINLKGEPGTSPHIGANHNWWIDDYDTGVCASGNSLGNLSNALDAIRGIAV